MLTDSLDLSELARLRPGGWNDCHLVPAHQTARRVRLSGHVGRVGIALQLAQALSLLRVVVKMVYLSVVTP